MGIESNRNHISVTMEKEFGEEYIEYRKKWQLAGKRKDYYKVPLHVDIDLTNTCNMSCISCNALPILNKSKFIIDMDILSKRLTEAIPLGVKSINFGNASEPLLSQEKLFNLINIVSSLGVMDIFIHTNGLLLNENISERIIQSDLKTLAISIDAVTEETFSKVGRKGFKVVVNNILQFIEMRSKMNSSFPFLRLSFLPNQYNYKEIKDFNAFWKDKADMVDIQNIINMNQDKSVSSLFKPQHFFCADPWKRLPIWSNNTYGICCEHFCFNEDTKNLYNLGFLYENSIADVWASQKINNIRESLLNNKYYPECKECIESVFMPDNEFFP